MVQLHESYRKGGIEALCGSEMERGHLFASGNKAVI